MQDVLTNPLEEIKQDVTNLLRKHNIKCSKLDIYETYDGYLVLIKIPQFKDHLKTIELSLRLSILPAD